MIVDTHCHLDFDAFDEDREEVIARSRAAGIDKLVNPGVDYPSSVNALKLAERYPEVFAAAGVHPNSIEKPLNGDELEALRQLLTLPKVKAVGEIGLDYHWNHSSPEIQQAVFCQQLSLAEEIEKPVIIHNREATEDILKILEEWTGRLRGMGSSIAGHPGVLHSFSADFSAAQRAMEMGFFIGIGGPVTFKNAKLIQDIVSQLPLVKVLIETDAPFLAPHPFRGKRNEPKNVQLVAEKIAMILQKPFEEIARVTTENAARLFNW